MTELLNNQTIQLIIAAVSAFGGTVTALVIFLSKIIAVVKGVKQNSAEFLSAKEDLKIAKKESEQLKVDMSEAILQIKKELDVIRKRQEIAYCNTKELVICGAAKSIMATSEEKEEEVTTIESGDKT